MGCDLMYIRDRNHPIKKVVGFDYNTNITRNYQNLRQTMEITGVTRHTLGNSSDGHYEITGLSFGDLSGKVLWQWYMPVLSGWVVTTL